MAWAVAEAVTLAATEAVEGLARTEATLIRTRTKEALAPAKTLTTELDLARMNSSRLAKGALVLLVARVVEAALALTEGEVDLARIKTKVNWA